MVELALLFQRVRTVDNTPPECASANMSFRVTPHLVPVSKNATTLQECIQHAGLDADSNATTLQECIQHAGLDAYSVSRALYFVRRHACKKETQKRK